MVASFVQEPMIVETALKYVLLPAVCLGVAIWKSRGVYRTVFLCITFLLAGVEGGLAVSAVASIPGQQKADACFKDYQNRTGHYFPWPK